MLFTQNIKVLVELAQLQDEEVGDGTTSVVIIAAELLRNADELVKQKIHPTSIIGGYRMACREAVKYIQVYYKSRMFFMWIIRLFTMCSRNRKALN